MGEINYIAEIGKKKIGKITMFLKMFYIFVIDRIIYSIRINFLIFDSTKQSIV